MERLKSQSVRDSTAQNYLGIWRNFNKFLIRLDRKPKSWEERTALYCIYLINEGAQSSTIKSCVSAIKSTLKGDGYLWDQSNMLLELLVKACKPKNDHVFYRFPIRLGLFEMLLFETARYFSINNQNYLEILYMAIFALAYYGMMRIGELVEGQHTVKAKDVHLVLSKNKIRIYLHTSKHMEKIKNPKK